MFKCVYCRDIPHIQVNCYCREIKFPEGMRLGELQVIAFGTGGKSVFLEEKDKK